MIVSHFELLFKNQAPANTTTGAVPDVAVQGYFLEITNLEAVQIEFLAEFVIGAPDASLPQRSLADNTLVFVDTPPGTDNRNGRLQGTLTDTVFRPRFLPIAGQPSSNIRIPAGGTALLAVLPSLFPSAADPTPLMAANFEVRGYVNLRVPALRGPGFFFTQSQSATPVNVLLTPQNRTSYLKAGVISDQTQASLPLATGAAQVAVPAEPGGFVPPVVFDKGLVRLERLMDGLALDAQEKADLLASLIAGIDPDKDDVAGFNKALAQAGVGLGLERRKARV
jgi:hypothetical protein